METRCSEDDSCFMESDDVIVIVITKRWNITRDEMLSAVDALIKKHL